MDLGEGAQVVVAVRVVRGTTRPLDKAASPSPALIAPPVLSGAEPRLVWSRKLLCG
jgi:hypothetical protein